MKRSPLKRKTPLKARKRGLRMRGLSESSVLKERIQALLRQIVIQRDRGCILRGERHCGGEPGVPGVVLQADHLITRANSATYADHRLVVCVCVRCHGWKNYHKEAYDALVKEILPARIVRLWEKCERESWRPTHKVSSDWKLHILALEQELTKLSN